MSADLLELRSITKRFSGIVALQDVNLSLRSGEILALVGENGAGKSTLMKILSGVYQPDSGEILLDGEKVALRNPVDAQARGISIIYQEFSLVPSFSVVDNLFLGCERTNRFGISSAAEMRRESQDILKRLGATFSIDTPVELLSVAEQQFVEIAKALLRRSRVLIMDEPTATLTGQEVERLLAIVRELVQQGIAIIFISHHLNEVFEIADSIVCLRDGQRVGQLKPSDCSQHDLIRMMVGRDVSQTFPDRPASGTKPIVLNVRQLQRKPHLPATSFQLCAGEILGIAGLVGAGRTKMVRALIGADSAFRQELLLDGKCIRLRSPADARAMGIGLVPENRQQQGLVIDASVHDNVLLASLRRFCHPRWGWLQRSIAKNASREQLEKLDVKASSVHQPVRTFSGGNQQKIVLAKWLLVDCRILILDEPTRGIDVGAKGEIYRLIRQLADRGVAILLISSELAEVIGLSDRVMVMRAQKIEHVFHSNESVSEEAIMSFAAGGNRG
ncbi:MAG: sugar ABC transporter ATP-binding protein [Pirellulaceae bacterium]|nr:sugar ABC transporter ATP-binding protein [Pirellulaceae bacterium]